MAKKPDSERKRPARPGEGGPSKYRPEYCQQLIDFMAKGYSIEAFAGDISVCIDTISEWVKTHPEFSAAKRLGQTKSLRFWEMQGIDGLRDEFQGSKFNSAVWIFNMKNRHRWRDKQEVEFEDKNETAREKIKKLSTTELKKLIKESE